MVYDPWAPPAGRVLVIRGQVFQPQLLRRLDTIRCYCKERNIRYTEADTLAAILEPPFSQSADCFDGSGWSPSTYSRNAVTDRWSRAKSNRLPFEEFFWDQRPELQLATDISRELGMYEVTGVHILLALMEDHSQPILMREDLTALTPVGLIQVRILANARSLDVPSLGIPGYYVDPRH